MARDGNLILIHLIPSFFKKLISSTPGGGAALLAKWAQKNLVRTQ